jgi:putative membrane protein
MEQKANEVELKKEPYNKLVIAVSILIPVAIAVLFGVKIPGYDFSFLPPIYATINGVTAILLVTAVVAIKRKNRTVHERLIKTCVILSATFLVLYVLYHMTSDSTPYGGEGPLRYVYFIILITHILLSVGVIPMVLFTYLRAWRGEFSRHRAIAKYTFPLWLYVAVTGVIVYLMISPYYS